MLRRPSQVVFMIGLLAVILVSVIPGDAVPRIGVRDVSAHMMAYAALAFVGGIACQRARSLLILTAGLVFLGMSLEVIQALIPSRDANGYELLADVVGIALGSAAALSTKVFLNKLSGS